MNRFPRFTQTVWSAPVALNADRSKWLTSLHRQLNSDEESYGRVYLLEAGQEQAKSIINVTQELHIYDHDVANDRTLATWNVGGSPDKRGELVIFEGFAKNHPKAIKRWRLPSKQYPYDYADEIPFIWWIDQDTALLQVHDDTCIYNLNNGKSLALFAPQIYGNHQLSVSPGHRYLAYPNSDGCFVLDLQQRQLIGEIPYNRKDWHQGAFSPDGSKLALAGGPHLLIWDLVAGKSLCEAEFESRLVGEKLSDIVWTNNGFLFCRDYGLLDTQTLLPIGRYELPKDCKLVAAPNAIGVYHHPESTPKMFGLLEMPQDLPEALANRMDQGPDKVWMIYPKVPVAISIEGTAGAEETKLRKYLSKAYQDAGWVEADEAPLQLIAKVTQLPAHEVRISRISKETEFMPETVKKVNIRTPGLTISVRYKGRELASMNRSNEATVGWIEKNETVEQVVARLKQLNLDEFKPINLPTHVLLPEAAREIPRFRFEYGKWVSARF